VQLITRWHDSLGITSASDYQPREVGGVVASLEEGMVWAAGRSGWLEARSLADGQIRWRFETGYEIASEPAYGQGLVVLGLADGRVVGFEARTGQTRWTYRARTSFQGRVTVGDTMAYALSSDNTLHAIHLRDGTGAWRHAQSRPSDLLMFGNGAVRELPGGGAVAGFSDGRLVRLQQDGTLVWVSNLAGESRRLVDVDTTPVVLGDLVLAASFTGGLHAVDLETGAMRWRLEERGVVEVLEAGPMEVVMLTSDGVLHWVEASAGQVTRSLDLEVRSPSRPVPLQDMLLITSAGHGMLVVDRTRPWVYARFDAGSGFSAPAGVAGTTAFAISDRGTLYAVDVVR
jgi:outer membrane protein assembly factor BamB